VQRSVDIVKVMASGGMGTLGTDILGTQFSTEEMRLLVERAHAAGLPVTAHAHSLSAVAQAVEVGVDGIEHCSCLTPTGPTVSDELLDSLVAGGIIVGSIAGLFATRYLQSTLYGVSRLDPSTYIGGAIVALLATLLGAFMPARRTSRIDPMISLRGEN